MMLCNRKKIVFLLAGCLLVFASFLGVPGAKEAEHGPQGQPLIYIPQVSYDFGEKMEGAEIEHDFTVRNTGVGALNIDRVKTS